jgi:hypothetical protein
MMMDHMNAHFVVWTTAILMAASAQAGELRPFVLPSQNAPSRMTEQRPTTASNSYYENFRIEVGRMDKNKIDALRADFRKRLADARNKQSYDEQAHYERMLGILEGK